MTIEVFIKKPEKVEVLKYDGTNYNEVVKFAGEEFQRIKGCFVKGDYIIKGVKGEFYPCKPDVFEETYDEYNESQDSNHNSRPSNFSLRNLVMQVAPKHIKYYIERLEEYGFKLYDIRDDLFHPEAILPYIIFNDEIGNQIWISNRKGFGGEEFQLFIPRKDERFAHNIRFAIKNNNWREAFNKLVASFPDEIMKNTNHHANLSS